MLLTKNHKFYKTIRFRLTLTYSIIILLFSSLVILSMNIFLDSYLRNDPPPLAGFRTGMVQPKNPFNELGADVRDKIREIRLNDLQNFQQFSVLSLIPITLLSFLLGYYISGRFLKPINDLSTKIQDIGAEQLGSILEKESDDEVGKLIDDFNSMSLRLRDSFDKQQKFVQDASHELKTPLTIIQTSLDTTLEDKSSNKDELREAMSDALHGVKRLRELTNDLLQISTPIKLAEKIDVVKLVKDQVNLLKEYSTSNKIQMSLKANDDIKNAFVKGNKNSLGRAIYNVIENGIKYSKHTKNAYVNIDISSDKYFICITIKDNGEGIPENIKDRIFDRFFRAQKSSEGNGLGLSISKEIIMIHRGSIVLTDNPKETEFEIKLPIIS
jgi:signal transduction histidine kinase